MSYHVQEAGGQLTLHFEGHLDTATVPLMKSEVSELVNRRPRDWTIDMSLVRMVDSTGVGFLVSIYKWGRATGGAVRMSGLQGQPLAVAKMLRLDRVMMSPPPLPTPGQRGSAKLLSDPLDRLRLAYDASERMRHAKEQKLGGTLLLGAGCSVSANVPTAAEIADLILQRYPKSARRASRNNYASLMQTLEIGERQDLIADLVLKGRLNITYRAVAQLVKKGLVDRILTTNFDGLLGRACVEAGVQLYEYDVADMNTYKTGLVRSPALFYLHGRDGGFLQFHTEPEMRRHARKLAPLIQDVVNRRPTIVVGYSGRDPIFDLLAEQKEYPYGLFWAHHGDELPEEHVLNELLTSNSGTYFILAGGGSDDFFTQLSANLGVSIPTSGVVDLPRRQGAGSAG